MNSHWPLAPDFVAQRFDRHKHLNLTLGYGFVPIAAMARHGGNPPTPMDGARLIEAGRGRPERVPDSVNARQAGGAPPA
jgi:hypothetical protein